MEENEENYKDLRNNLSIVTRTFFSMYTQMFFQRFTVERKDLISILKVIPTLYLKPTRTRKH